MKYYRKIFAPYLFIVTSTVVLFYFFGNYAVVSSGRAHLLCTTIILSWIVAHCHNDHKYFRVHEDTLVMQQSHNVVWQFPFKIHWVGQNDTWIGIYIFNANAWYEKSGFFHLDVDECTTASPCNNGGTCNNTLGSYECMCTPQWNGTNCGEGETQIRMLYDYKCNSYRFFHV